MRLPCFSGLLSSLRLSPLNLCVCVFVPMSVCLFAPTATAGRAHIHVCSQPSSHSSEEKKRKKISETRLGCTSAAIKHTFFTTIFYLFIFCFFIPHNLQLCLSFVLNVLFKEKKIHFSTIFPAAMLFFLTAVTFSEVQSLVWTEQSEVH